jgi:hypothetical protein
MHDRRRIQVGRSHAEFNTLQRSGARRHVLILDPINLRERPISAIY